MVVPINAPRIEHERRQAEESDIDKLLKALSVANQGMGIAVNYQKFQDFREERELRPAQEERAAAESAQSIKTGAAAEGASTALTEQRRKQTAALPTGEEARAERLKTAKIKRDERITKFQKDFQSSKAFTDITGAHRAAGNLRALMEPGPNGETPSNLQAQMALRAAIKASGDARPSDQDIRSMVPDPSLAAKVNREYELALAGKPPEGDIEALQTLGLIMERSAENQLEEQALAFAKTQGQQFGDDAQMIADEFLVPGAFTGATGPADLRKSKGAAGAEDIPLAPGGGQQATPPRIDPATVKALMEQSGMDEAEAIRQLKIDRAEQQRAQ